MSLADYDLGALKGRVRPPLAIALGAPALTAQLVRTIGVSETTCWQLDLHQAARLREELALRETEADVAVTPDLWDLGPRFQTVLFPAAAALEREMKLDVIEQAFHILLPQGMLIVLSEHEKDDLFPRQLKKFYGRFHAPNAKGPSILWARRENERERRRHEQTFHVRTHSGESLRFLSRPGVFSYGRMDNGTRALCETMEIQPGDSIVDIGSGVGTNGVWAARLGGDPCRVTFIDSNVRAVALSDLNARANGLTQFTTMPSNTADQLQANQVQVALANPPYYAQFAIARQFIALARRLLTAQGRLYVVTKQPRELAEELTTAFAEVEAGERRGYVVFTASNPLR